MIKKVIKINNNINCKHCLIARHYTNFFITLKQNHIPPLYDLLQSSHMFHS